MRLHSLTAFAGILAGICLIGLTGCAKTAPGPVIAISTTNPVITTQPTTTPAPSISSDAQAPAVTSQPAADRVICHIALVSDTHVGATSNFEPYIDRFEQIIAQINQSTDIDLVLLSGDLVQDPTPANEARFMELVHQISKPTLFVPGNHDLGNKPLGGEPSKVTEANLLLYKTTIGELWFAKQVTPELRIIGLSSPLFGSKLPDEQAQWDFLDKQLAQPQPGFTILLTHYPLFVGNADEDDRYQNMNRPARQHLLSLAKQAKVLAVLSGHLHYPLELSSDGMTFLGAPAVSFGTGESKGLVGWRTVDLHADGTLTTELHMFEKPAGQVPEAPQPNK